MATYPVPAVDIGYAGESAVVSALRAEGWTITSWDTRGAGSTDIEATKNGHKILVQVKAAVAPGQPAEPSGDEIRNIKSRATRIGAVAYVAMVTFTDYSLSRSNGVGWRELE